MPVSDDDRPTSAQLADAQAQLGRTIRERDSLARRLAVRHWELTEARNRLDAIAAILGADPSDPLPALVHDLTVSNRALRHQLDQALRPATSGTPVKLVITDRSRHDPLAEHGRCGGCGGGTCTCPFCSVCGQAAGFHRTDCTRPAAAISVPSRRAQDGGSDA